MVCRSSPQGQAALADSPHFIMLSTVLATLDLHGSVKCAPVSPLLSKSWLRTSKMLKIETIAKNFKIFWSLQVRSCVFAYRTLRAWQSLNRDKRKLRQICNFFFKNQILKEQHFFKFLGVHKDNSLTWKTHINHVCKKASKVTGIIFRSRYFLTEKKTLLSLSLLNNQTSRANGLRVNSP